MAIDPSISLAVRPPVIPPLQIQTPLEKFAKIQTLRNLMTQGQSGQLDLQTKTLQLQQLQEDRENQRKLLEYLTQRQGTAGAAQLNPAGIAPSAIPLQTAPVQTPPLQTVPQTAPAQLPSPPSGAPLSTLMTPQAPVVRPDAKSGPYLTTLTPPEEAQFQAWVKTNNVPFDPSPTADYDMRGFWRSMMAGQSARSSTNLHFPDTFKTPYHQSFSNESMYATGDAPHWEGTRLVDKSGKVVFDESQGGQAPAVPQAGAPGAPLGTLARPVAPAAPAAAQSAALPATGGSGGFPAVNLGEIVTRFGNAGMAYAQKYNEAHKAELENQIKQADLDEKRAAGLAGIGIRIRDSKDPATQFNSGLMEAAAKGYMDPALARQMQADGWEKHKNDVQGFIDQAQKAKDQAELHKSDMAALLDERKNVALAMRGVKSQSDYESKITPILSRELRREMGDTWTPQLSSVVSQWDVSGAQLPKVQLEQIQTDAVRLIGAMRQGPDAAKAVFADLSPDSQKALAGAKTEQDVYQRAHPEAIAENLKPTGEFERTFLPAFAGRLKNSDGTPKSPDQLTPDQKIQAFREFKVDPAQQSLANAQKLLALVQTRMQLAQAPTPEQAQEVAKDVVAHRLSPEQMAQLFSTRGKEGMAFKLQVFNAAKKIDPEFDFEQASAEYQLTKSPAFQNTVRYMDSVQESLPQLIDRAKALDNGGVRSINTLINSGKDQFNNINLKKFNTDRLLLADEVAKILQGGGTGSGTSDAKLKQAESLFRANDDPASIAAAADEVKQLIGYRRKALTRGTYFERTGQGGAGAAGTVKMKAPDGTVRDIPADQVDHYKSIGAKVVQ